MGGVDLPQEGRAGGTLCDTVLVVMEVREMRSASDVGRRTPDVKHRKKGAGVPTWSWDGCASSAPRVAGPRLASVGASRVDLRRILCGCLCGIGFALLSLATALLIKAMLEALDAANPRKIALCAAATPLLYMIKGCFFFGQAYPLERRRTPRAALETASTSTCRRSPSPSLRTRRPGD